MDKIIEILNINWVHQTIGIACFMLGIILGAIAVSIIWKRFSSKEKQQEKVVKDVSYITKNAISAYNNGNSKLDAEKIVYLCNALNFLLETIPQEYGNSKAYEIIKQEDMAVNGKALLSFNLKLHLDFTVYEFLGFVNLLASQMERELTKILNSNLVSLVWGVGKIAFKNKIEEGNRRKDLDDITIEGIRQTILRIVKKDNESEKQESKIKKIFKPIVDKAIDKAKDLGNSKIDSYVREIIVIFAEELNKLYSGQLKGLTVKALSQSFQEEGV